MNKSGPIDGVIVCSAGEKSGLGHYKRSKKIIRILQNNQEFKFDLIVIGDNQLSNFDQEFTPFFVDSVEELNKIPCLIKKQISLVIFDLNLGLIGNNIKVLFNNLKKRGIKLISIDGFDQYENILDLIYVPSFFNKKEEKEISKKICYGWDSYLLDIEKKNYKYQTGKKILVLTGGSDTKKLNERLPMILANKIPKEYEIHWVIGPFASDFEVQKEQNVIKHYSPKNLQEIMKKSNYAIIPYRVSFCELLYLGIPTVVFSPYEERQVEKELVLIEEKLISSVAKNEEEIVIGLLRLIKDEKLAERLSSKSQKLMEHSNGKKLLSAVRKLFN